MFFIVFITFSCVGVPRVSGVTSYPGLEGGKESSTFTVEVNGQRVWTEYYVSNLDVDQLPDWFNAAYVREPQEMHIASFEGVGALDIVITVRDEKGRMLQVGSTRDENPMTEKGALNEKVAHVSVKPFSRGITPELEENRIHFSWQATGQLIVEVEGLPPLFLFINPREEKVPDPNDPDVIYFGPGVHEVGFIEMKDNQTVYLAPGSLVYGGIRAQGASNIKVRGRGVLDGDYRYSQMVLLEECSDVLFEGITIRNSKHWTNTLVNCRDVEYHNVKVIGFGPSSDGINPMGSQRVKITHSFMRCTDDCVAIKALNPLHPVEQITVENNIMIGYAYADGVTIGFETNAEYVKDIVVRDCDILLARGGSRVDGHSGFSIICDGRARISNVLFKDIRVERSEIKLFELHITDGTKYGDGPPGHINDVTIRNVEWFHEGPIVIQGYDEHHQVENIRFQNCRVAGVPLAELQEEVMRVNAHVQGLSIE